MSIEKQKQEATKLIEDIRARNRAATAQEQLMIANALGITVDAVVKILQP